MAEPNLQKPGDIPKDPFPIRARAGSVSSTPLLLEGTDPLLPRDGQDGDI
jgi:hypothetical protein